MMIVSPQFVLSQFRWKTCSFSQGNYLHLVASLITIITYQQCTQLLDEISKMPQEIVNLSGQVFSLNMHLIIINWGNLVSCFTKKLNASQFCNLLGIIVPLIGVYRWFPSKYSTTNRVKPECVCMCFLRNHECSMRHMDVNRIITALLSFD